MSKQAVIYLLCHLAAVIGPLVTLRMCLSLGPPPFGIGAFWLSAVGGLWCAAWMIAGRLYVMRHGTGRKV